MEQTETTQFGLGLTWPMKKENTPPSAAGMTDEQAMWLVQSDDDHKAFAMLVKKWELPIFRLCTRLTGDPHGAEDLKQETFSRVFARRKEFQMGSKFSTWLWRIALNLCYDEIRRAHRHAKRFESAEANPLGRELPDSHHEEETPYLSVVRSEEQELVRHALGHLDEKLRTAVVLRYCEGLKYREIAEILEIPEATVQSRIVVGLTRLTRILHPEFGEHLKDEDPK